MPAGFRKKASQEKKQSQVQQAIAAHQQSEQGFWGGGSRFVRVIWVIPDVDFPLRRLQSTVETPLIGFAIHLIGIVNGGGFLLC